MKAKEEKVADKERNAVVIKVAYEYKARKEDQKWQALDKASHCRGGTVFEWVKLSFDSGNATTKREAQKL